jgi:EmrB/QacA subfamily drug resistance transporter
MKSLMTEYGRVRRAVVLGVCCMSVLLAGIDMTAVNLALPAIGSEFHATVGGLSWTIDAYTLTLAAFLLFSASMADRIGCKRVFLIGLCVFVVGSALCAFAPSLGWLIAFRVLQAIGGSMLNPVAMAILSAAYPQRAERARAIGVWAGATGIALAVGPILGGALVDSTLGWRWIFAINIPIGIVAIVVAAVAVAESKAARARRFDPLAQLLVVVLLTGLTYGIIEGGRDGWGTPSVIVGLAAAVSALVGILLYEPRRRDPMLQLAFFRSIPFSGANLIAVAAFALLSSFLFLNSLYLQQGRGFTALQAGLMIVPLAVVSLVYGPINGRILARWGSRPCLIVAGVSYTAAAFMLVNISAHSLVWWLLVAYALFGLGGAAVGAPITHTAVAGMPPSQAGLAAGVSSTTRQIGSTLGVAIASVILGANVAGNSPSALIQSMHAGWWLNVGYGLFALLLGILTTTPWARRTATTVAVAVAEDLAPTPAAANATA